MRNLIIPLLAAGALVLSTAPVHADLGDQLAKLLADERQSNDRFGWSVAVSGDVAVIGNLPPFKLGDAYVFDISDPTNPVQLFKLGPDDGIAKFGWSVAVSGDVAVIGTHRSDEFAPAYVFDVTTGQQLFKLLPATTFNGGNPNGFGWSVAVSGNLAVISAWGDRENGLFAGAAYVFDVTTGQQLFKLLADDGITGETFGWSVAADGNLAVIGKPADSDHGPINGSAYVFDMTTGQQLFKLFASDPGVQDQFGIAVALSGNRAVIGVPFDDDDDNGVDSGSAYVFDVTTGEQLFKLLPEDDDDRTSDRFGHSVAVSGDIAFIGMPLGDRVDNTQDSTGSAYVFDVTTGEQLARLLAADGAVNDNFGHSVAVSSDVALISAIGDDDNTGGDWFGSVYLLGLSVDSDGDGLSDADEAALGTDPNNPDTDGDGLLDGAEVEMAQGSGCPDPLNPDSDGDTLSDGAEVDAGTNPCNVDTDGDTLTDDVDPHPLDPEVSSGDLEDATRFLCLMIQTLDLSLFNGPNDNANAGRRNALANRCANAANAIAINDIDSAIDELASLLAKIDGDSPPPDWMDSSNEKTALANDVIVLIALLLVL